MEVLPTCQCVDRASKANCFFNQILIQLERVLHIKTKRVQTLMVVVRGYKNAKVTIGQCYKTVSDGGKLDFHKLRINALKLKCYFQS